VQPAAAPVRDFGWNHPAYRNFATIDRRALNRFFELGTELLVPAGAAILRAGSASDGIHLLLEGRLAVTRAGRRLRELAPGDFVGEASLFRADPAPDDVQALGASTLLCIRRDAAIDYMVLHPEFGMALCALLVRENLTQLAELSEVYIANRALTEQVESKNETLRQAIVTVEQTARLVSQSPHPVLRISNAGQLLFANAPAEPILRSWRAAIGSRVPASWRTVVREALEAGSPRALELGVDGAVFMLTVVPLADLGYVNVYAQDVTQERRKTAQIEHMALHDDLTGLPNRAALRQQLDGVIARPPAAAGAAALILLDIDGLEPIRALFGHPVSDQLLVEAGRRLDALIGSTGMVATLGANHFAILLESTHDEASATAATARIVDRLSVPFEVDSHRLQLGVRAGISLVGDLPGERTEDVLKRADLAKHRVGADPHCSFSVYRPALEQSLREEHALEAELRQAIGTDQIEVWFQPKVGLVDGVTVGAEALARWRHPTRGMVLPERFIPIAERTGMIRELGEQVLRTACRTAAGWAMQDHHVAVNLSALQLRQADIVERVAAILQETGLPAHRLDLEITESLLVEDTDRALVTLTRLRELGVRLSLDDFGTGYSCLSYLARLKFDKIKIDRSFVIDMHRSAEMRKIAKTIVRLGANLEMTVVAEGIELNEQRELLCELGCTEGQGYLFSAPLSSHDWSASFDSDVARPMPAPYAAAS
jgi:diguanylate cyclase (GGDEF)-like protein